MTRKRLLQEMIHQKELELQSMISSKYQEKGKKIHWDEKNGFVNVGNQAFNINAINNDISKRIQEKHNESIKDLEGKKAKKIVEVWESSINDNLDLTQNFDDYYLSQNCK